MLISKLEALILTRIFISSPLPPTLNEMLAASRGVYRDSSGNPVGGSKYSSIKASWTDFFVSAIESSLDIQGEPWHKAWIKAEFFVPFSHDPDNVLSSLKFPFDSLQTKKGVGLIRNDNLSIIQSPVVAFFKKAKRGEERLELTISDSPIFELVEIPDPNVFRVSSPVCVAV